MTISTSKRQNRSGGKQPSKTKLTMSDAARTAGVSPITVSRSLKQKSLVARKTREHVLKVVDQLGYVPDLLASGLASQRSGFVAVMVPSLNNPRFAELELGQEHLSRTLRSLGRILIQSELIRSSS